MYTLCTAEESCPTSSMASPCDTPDACNNVAAVALAAKNARIIWAMLARGTDYRVAVAETA